MSIRARLPLLPLLAGALVPLPASGQGVGASEPATARIALVEDGPARDLPFGLEGLRRELVDTARGELEIQFPPSQHRVGDWTRPGVARVLDELYARADVDLVIATGPIGTHELLQRTELPVPSIGMRVIDAELQSAPFSGPGSGVPNLNYLSAPLNLARDIEAFRELTAFERVTLLSWPALAEALPGLMEAVVAELAGAGVEVDLLDAGGTVDELLERLPEDCEAVYVPPLPQLEPEEFDSLVRGLSERGLPSFSLIGADDVRRGVLASLAPETDLKGLARRTALSALRILSGELAGDLPTTVGGRERLTINAATARSIGVWPRFAVLTEAELVGIARPAEELELSLSLVMHEAMRVNRSLRAAELVVLSGQEDVARARSSLRPQVDLGASWTVIDEDQASLGRAERTLAAQVTGSQVLWAEGVWAGLEVEHQLQGSREADLEALVLDVLQDAAIAYLDVLRARTLERIRREDLKLTRSNLELAQVRNELGVSGPAEVYRWESRIATSRRAVLDARAGLRVAELELNRILHQPLEQPFTPVEVDLSDPSFLVDERLERYIDNPWTFRVLRDFEVRAGLAVSPELASLDGAIRAQERALASARRAHWQPALSLDGSLTDVFDADGTGAQVPAPFVGIIPDAEMTTWSASLVGSFPLLTGGAKRSAERRARHELVRLRYQREATRELIEQRIRSSLHTASASFAGIRLSRSAAEAAARNQELVTDSYSRGVLSIIDLLEAQNAALVANESAANAVHDFAVDLIRVQRAVGRFTLFLSEAQRERWFEELDEFRQLYGAPLLPR